MDDPQEAFLRREFFQLALRAAVSRPRPPIYAPGVPEGLHGSLHDALRRGLDEESRAYAEAVSEDGHVEAIVRMTNRLSEECGDILHDGRFRVGPAQKALNLFLKYLWCAGLVHEPPHCPFDSVIIQQLPASVRVNWTALDDVDGYVRLVKAAEDIAGSESLAVWELRLYARLADGRGT